MTRITGLLVFGYAASLVGQAAMPSPEWLGFGRDASFGALVAWLFWYTQTRSIPRMTETFAGEMAKQRAHAEAQLDKVIVQLQAQEETVRLMIGNCQTRQRGEKH